MRRPLARPMLRVGGVAGLAALGCTTRVPVAAPTGVSALARLDAVAPHALHYCAATAVDRRGEKPGGEPGHSVILVRGLALDPRAPYPRVRLAPLGAPPESASAGLSVNRDFTNVNWIGSPAPWFFLRGDAPPDAESLRLADVERTVERALALGVFRGVTTNLPANPDSTLRQRIAETSVATDFALTFGRTLECVVVPLTPSMLAPLAAHLNDRNARYAETGRPYHWNGLRNNCAHLGHNALAALGIVRPLELDRHGPAELFDVAIPANELAVMLAATTDGALGEPDDVLAYWRDTRRRRLLLEHGWLAPRPGAMLVVHHQLPFADSTYADAERLWFVRARPLVHGRAATVERAMRTPRLTDLDSNLTWFASRARRSLAARRPPEHHRAAVGADSLAFADFHARFYAAVDAQLRAVESVGGRGVPEGPR
ncbi:MAG TPA: hypothetical protein VFY16_04090 [Gemmatimonadaceae bacterium]|nr:hypothetical protein [Gemmatimonadaceae bacterium]